MRHVAGRYYVVDCVAEALGPADVNRLVLNSCVQDALVTRREGVVYAVRWEEEPGSAGKLKHAAGGDAGQKAFAVHGLSVDAAGVRSTGDKGTACEQLLASTAGVGGVWLVAGMWTGVSGRAGASFPMAGARATRSTRRRGRSMR